MSIRPITTALIGSLLLGAIDTSALANNPKFAGCIITFKSPKLFVGQRTHLFPAANKAWQFKVGDKGNTYTIRVLDGDSKFDHMGHVDFSTDSQRKSFIMVSRSNHRIYTTFAMADKSYNKHCVSGIYHIGGHQQLKGMFGSAMGRYTLCCPKD